MGSESKPRQPARGPREDVQVQEEACRAPRDKEIREGFCRHYCPGAGCAAGIAIMTCDSRNRIGLKRGQATRRPPHRVRTTPNRERKMSSRRLSWAWAGAALLLPGL